MHGAGYRGPLVVVRVWLEKFGVWLLLATTAYLTYYLLSRYGLSALIAQPGSGDLPFPLAVDLVVALPLSWLPLAADYNRFARSTRGASLGTYLGFFVANVWFFALGAVAVLALQTQNLIASILALTIGGVALIIILADETDNAFADIYSAAVSTRNFLTGTSHWKLATFFGVLGFVAAVLLPIEPLRGVPAAPGISVRSSLRGRGRRLLPAPAASPGRASPLRGVRYLRLWQRL